MPSEHSAAIALAEQAPARNELMDKLDAALQERARATVDAALVPAEQAAGDIIAKALAHVTGGSFRALIAAQMMESVNRIREEATRRTYQELLKATLAQFTPDAATA